MYSFLDPSTDLEGGFINSIMAKHICEWMFIVYQETCDIRLAIIYMAIWLKCYLLVIFLDQEGGFKQLLFSCQFDVGLQALDGYSYLSLIIPYYIESICYGSNSKIYINI